MTALRIHDVKSFMSSLLVHNIFDQFLLTELEILTFNHFSIDGRLNLDWYNQEELEDLGSRSYSTWKETKPFAYQLIKGNKTPHSFKIVFLLGFEQLSSLLLDSQITMQSQDVNGLFINVKFENGTLSLITGTSLRMFTLDKTLEHEWDVWVQSFLKQQQIVFEVL